MEEQTAFYRRHFCVREHYFLHVSRICVSICACELKLRHS